MFLIKYFGSKCISVDRFLPNSLQSFWLETLVHDSIGLMGSFPLCSFIRPYNTGAEGLSALSLNLVVLSVNAVQLFNTLTDLV